MSWLSAVPAQGGGKGSACALGVCAMSSKLNSTKFLGICLGMMLVQAEFLEVLAVDL